MAYVHVSYESIKELVEKFQTLNLIRDAALPSDIHHPPNFVLVNPARYYGCYGGIVHDSVLDRYRLQLHETHSLRDSIGNDLSIVWWNTKKPLVTGDQNALTVEDRVAVTPKMFEKMRINTIRQHGPPRSKYYGTKAWCINATSCSNSDSE